MDTAQLNHALGALQGLALGDALGMPTQSMSHEQILSAYGDITTLRDAVAEQPIAPSMPAGSVTDDTEQALLVADLLVKGEGHIDALALAHTLLAWEDDMIRRGSHDLLGPSTKYALEQIRAGADSRTTGRTGTTNGAAMRVTPVGIAHSVQRDVHAFAGFVHESCKVTHNTVHGFSAAALVASAVSLGAEGASVQEALSGALRSVEAMSTDIARFDCAWSAKADVLTRVKKALEMAENIAEEETFFHTLRWECGTSVESNESVPAAFALAWRYNERPFDALCTAATLGGDTDTIGAMCGAMLGACCGTSAWPVCEVERMQVVSGLHLADKASALLPLRTL
ncbi:ADP-ribosylglycohydrolase family protein [Alloscardovia criceti]|uniref:ADP-ribosylglycohydrolase family protein n=1 Tax=Alloscardovia criceti TaxID=356828 RepID=UPI0012EA2DB0|nr:ADP-ribosylglycohydrolase family protein [Alloscardovia criceti]